MAGNGVPVPTIRLFVEELDEVTEWYTLGIHLDIPTSK